MLSKEKSEGKSCVPQEEEEEENENVINTCNNYISQRVIKSINVARNDFQVLEEFEKVSLAESGKRGFSETTIKAWAEYVKRHGRGNSQLKLINYVDSKAPSPLQQLCHYSRGHTNDGQVFCTNFGVVKAYDMVVFKGIKGAWICGVTCYSCDFNKLRRNEK
jgi:hypothetical protein